MAAHAPAATSDDDSPVELISVFCQSERGEAIIPTNDQRVR